MNTTVPKIIHQTWKTTDIPEELKFCVASWKDKNPDWKYILWTHETMEEFVEEHFPEMYVFYCKYKFDIFRADFFRLLVLYKMGGVYVDLDMECIKGLDELFDEHIHDVGLCLSKRPAMFAKMYKVPLYIQNFFIVATPGNEILGKIIQDIMNKGTDHDVKRVTYITGPLAVTESLNHMSTRLLIKKGLLKILDERIIGLLVNISWGRMYTDKGAIHEALKTIHVLLTREFPQETYMVHYFHGTYSNNKSMLLMTKDELRKLKKKLLLKTKYHLKYNCINSIDPYVGLVGIYLKKISPKLYFRIRKIVSPFF